MANTDKAKLRKIGDPLEGETEQGPQVSQEQLDKTLHYVKVGQDRGAKFVGDGKCVGSKGYFVEPTIFDNVKDEMTIAKDEIFGPSSRSREWMRISPAPTAPITGWRRASGRRTSRRPISTPKKSRLAPCG